MREEEARLRARTERAKIEQGERAAKREAAALAAKIREEVERELAREREEENARAERACAEEGARAKSTTVYSKVVPDGTALELSGDVELAPEPERKKVPAATPQKSPTKPEKPPAETKTASAEKPAKEEREEKPRAVTKAPEPVKKSAPKPYKAEWSPPNAKKPEGKRSRSPLATNRATSDASKEKTRPSERKVTSTTTRPGGRVSAPVKTVHGGAPRRRREQTVLDETDGRAGGEEAADWHERRQGASSNVR